MTKDKIYSVMKFIASMSNCSAINKTNELSGHIPYTRDDEHNTLFLAMPLTDMFMMHVFPVSYKIAWDKFLEHEFDEEDVKFIQISRGEAVLFKSSTVFGLCCYNNIINDIGTSTANVPFHDVAIHCYINLPGYNPPPEAMNSETHVVKSHNGNTKNIDGYFAYEKELCK